MLIDMIFLLNSLFTLLLTLLIDSDDNFESDSPDFDFHSLTIFYTNADNKRDELQMFIGNEPANSARDSA